MPHKEHNGDVEVVLKKGTWAAKIPTALIVTLMAGLLGVNGWQIVQTQSSPGATSAIESSPSFVRLDNRLETHFSQQEKDATAQRERDRQQDGSIVTVGAGVNMLNEGMVGVQIRMETMQAKQDDMAKDIKELLRRQGVRPGGNP